MYSAEGIWERLWFTSSQQNWVVTLLSITSAWGSITFLTKSLHSEKYVLLLHVTQGNKVIKILVHKNSYLFLVDHTMKVSSNPLTYLLFTLVNNHKFIEWLFLSNAPDQWNSLIFFRVLYFLPLEVYKGRLDGTLGNQPSGRCPCPHLFHDSIWSTDINFSPYIQFLNMTIWCWQCKY